MIGQIVAHYQVLEKLGEGGMGLVYKAKDLKLNRLVALKFLSAEALPSESAHTRFLQEAHAISALNHSNIATIYGVEEFKGQPVLVLEYLPGGTLRSWAHNFWDAGARIPFEQILRYAIQIGRGLSHAHQHGIVHRDVKPANVLLTAEGTLKLTDFGLSKFFGAANLTNTGTTMGTPGYMSPEQARGEDADPRSDIFSFGIVLYELATGERPFHADHDSAVVYQILNAAPRPPNQLRPDLSPELAQVIERTLEKNPGKRYQSMQDLLADLRPLYRDPDSVSTVPEPPTITMPVDTLRAWWRKLLRPRVLVSVLAAALLLILGVLLLLPRLRQRNPPAAGQLVVLPFANVGGDPANQAFCDGLVETLTSMLSQIEQFQGSLLVVPASEIRTANIASVRQARQLFAVDLVISGSVQRTGDGVRVTANLVDARSVRQIGARSIDTRAEDLPSLQDNIAGQVIELLELQVQPQVRQRLAAGTKVPAAFDAYFQGRGYLQRFDKAGNYEDAIPRFELALRLDPGYAQAYAGLAEAYLRKYEFTRDPRWVEEAGSATSKALTINDRLAPAHIDLGVIDTIRGRYDEAGREFHRALDLDRINADVYREMAKAYTSAGKLQEAEAAYKRAIQLRPNYWLAHKDLGVFYLRYGSYSAAENSFRRVVELTPESYVAYRNLGAIYHLLGRYTEAAEALRKSISIEPSSIAYTNLGTVYFFEGRYKDAVSMDEKAIELGAGDYTAWGNLADAYRWVPALASKAPETYREAIRRAQKQLELAQDDPVVLSKLAVYRVKLGDRSRALAEIEQAQELAPADRSVQFKSATVYELTGQRGLALKALGAAIKSGYSIEEIRRDPELAKLRKDPRFNSLLTQAR